MSQKLNQQNKIPVPKQIWYRTFNSQTNDLQKFKKKFQPSRFYG